MSGIKMKNEKTVLITGASGGIGRATINRFTEKGWCVIGIMLAPHNFNSSLTVWERVNWSTIKNLAEGLGLKYESEAR